MDDQPTLSQRLHEPFSAQDAFQCTMQMAQALRRLHEQGNICGHLDPASVVLADSEAKLVRREPPGGPTPYTAPEQLEGKPADTRSDIFAFGAVVYEVLSGRKAFDGHTPEEWRAAILEREPAPLNGVPPDLARLVSRCLERSPQKRWQRMPMVVMELKLLDAVSRRAQDAAAAKERLETAIRSAVAKQEAKFSARLESQEAAAEEMRRCLSQHDEKWQAAGQAEAALRAEIAALDQRTAARFEAGEAKIAEAERQAREQETRAASANQAVESLEGSIQALKTAAAQTDDLVERVMEIFSSQLSAMEPHDAVVSSAAAS